MAPTLREPGRGTANQKHFHHTRRLAVPRHSDPIPLSRQSTLTQLHDFFDMPRSSSTSGAKSENEGPREQKAAGRRRIKTENGTEDDDEEYEDLPPKKKRKGPKGLKKSREQANTLTQNWARLHEMSSSAVAEEDEVQAWKDELYPQSPQAVDSSRLATNPAAHDNPVQIIFSSAQSFQIPNQTSPISPPDSTRPTTARSTVAPKTPSRVRRREVPSSQTPASAKLSSRSTRFRDAYSRSPLKPRDVNSQIPKPIDFDAGSKLGKISLPSQRASPRKRDVRKFKRVTTIQDSQADFDSLNASLREPSKTCITVQNSEADRSIPQKMVRSPLKRMNTVQDSQAELDSLNASMRQTAQPLGTTKNSQTGQPVPEKIDRSPLKRVNTVQDSQAEDDISNGSSVQSGKHLDSITESEANTEGRLGDAYNPAAGGEVMTVVESDHDEEEEEEEDDGEYSMLQETQYPETYDPANAALDRDALRFGQTETQIDASELLGQTGFENFESVDETEAAHRAADPVSQGLDEPIQIVEQSPLLSSKGKTTAETSIEDHPASMHRTGVRQTQENPAPWPSQASTVLSSPHGSPHRHFSARSIDTQVSAYQSGPPIPLTLSSSPFPLPPMESMGEDRQASLSTPAEPYSDFSLPPPPPLLSSCK